MPKGCKPQRWAATSASPLGKDATHVVARRTKKRYSLPKAGPYIEYHPEGQRGSSPEERVVEKRRFREFLIGIGFSTYAEYLASPLWRSIRGKILKAAKGKCHYCRGLAYQVHHERYTEGNLLGKTEDGLQATCKTCHEAQHPEHYPAIACRS